MQSISAVLIVKNEAPRLAACLEALRGVVDEIVVADTGSTDNTHEIARQFTAHCYEIPWEDDFAAARNQAISFAAGPWILSVDADEVLDDPAVAREALRSFTQTQPANATGTLRHLSPSGSAQAVVSGEVERFFHQAEYAFDGIIHEQLVPRNGPHGPTRFTGIVVRHSGYQQDDADPAHKGLRNLPLLERAVADHPDDEYYRYQLGRTLFALKRYHPAILAFEAALARIHFDTEVPLSRAGVPIGRETLTTLITSLAYAYANSGRLLEADTLLSTHNDWGHAGTHWADFHHARGYIALMLGELDRARTAYSDSIRCGAAREDVAGTGSFASAFHLGLIAEANQDRAGAIAHYADSLRYKPDYTVSLDRVVDFIIENQLSLAPEIEARANPDAFRAICCRKLKERMEAGDKASAAFLIATFGLRDTAEGTSVS